MADLRALIRESTGDVRNLVPGGADVLEVSDYDFAGAMNFGPNAGSIDIGQGGILTTIKGDFQVDGATTLVSTSTLEGDVDIGDGGNTITIGGDGVAGAGDVIYLGTESTGVGSDSDVTLRTLMLVDGAGSNGRITGDDATFDFSDSGCGVIIPNVAAGSAVASDGSIIIDGSDLKWYDGAAWFTAAFLGGVTLDYAYDGVGAGAGRIITCDSGAVEITGSNAADYALEVANSGDGGALFVNSTGLGNVVDFQDGGGNVFQIADGGAFDLDPSTFDLHATGNITIDTSGGVIDIDATGVVDIDSSGGAIGIGTNPVAQNINIGTGASERIITVGNATLATAVNILSGTAGINLHDGVAQLDLDGAGALSTTGVTTMDLDGTGVFQINSTGGAINIGNDADAQDINIGTGIAARTITIGEPTTVVEVQVDALLVDLNAGATGMTLDSVGQLLITNTGVGGLHLASTGKEVLIDADQEIEINSANGPIKIGNDAIAQAIEIGTGGARPLISIGNVLAVEVQVDALLVDINAGNAITINAGAASNFTVDSADLTLQTTTSNDVIVDAFRDVLIKNNTNTVATFDASGITLAAGASIDEFSTDGTLGDNSDDAVPTEKAVKTYVDGAISGADVWLATADEAISIGDAICGALGTDDRVNQSNADSTGAGRQHCLGFATTAAAGAGNTCNVQSFGLAAQVTCPAGEAWVRGNAIYLDDVAAQVSNVAPIGVGDVVQRVGWAAETENVGTARTMFIAIGDPTVV